MISVDGLPSEMPAGRKLALELYELAAAGGVSKRVVEIRLGAISGLLASDPNSVVDIVALPATGATGLGLTIGIRDDFRVKLALGAYDSGHGSQVPSVDSAERSRA